MARHSHLGYSFGARVVGGDGHALHYGPSFSTEEHRPTAHAAPTTAWVLLDEAASNEARAPEEPHQSGKLEQLERNNAINRELGPSIGYDGQKLPQQPELLLESGATCAAIEGFETLLEVADGVA